MNFYIQNMANWVILSFLLKKKIKQERNTDTYHKHFIQKSAFLQKTFTRETSNTCIVLYIFPIQKNPWGVLVDNCSGTAISTVFKCLVHLFSLFNAQFTEVSCISLSIYNLRYKTCWTDLHFPEVFSFKIFFSCEYLQDKHMLLTRLKSWGCF